MPLPSFNGCVRLDQRVCSHVKKSRLGNAVQKLTNDVINRAMIIVVWMISHAQKQGLALVETSPPDEFNIMFLWKMLFN